MRYAIYDIGTGRIRKIVTCPQSEVTLQYDAGTEDAVETAISRESLYYVIGGVVAQRPHMNVIPDKHEVIANGIDVVTVSGVELGARITVGDVTEIADGSDIEFATDTPGEHRLTIELFPYLPAEVFINAN